MIPLHKVQIPPDILRVWNQVPKMECKGLCAEACGPWKATTAEIALLRSVTSAQPTRDDQCPFLKEERCTVYRIRPLICRLWGHLPSMACSHGCKTRAMTDEEGFDLIQRMYAVGGKSDSIWQATTHCIMCQLELGPAEKEAKINVHIACLDQRRELGNVAESQWVVDPDAHPSTLPVRIS